MRTRKPPCEPQPTFFGKSALPPSSGLCWTTALACASLWKPSSPTIQSRPAILRQAQLRPDALPDRLRKTVQVLGLYADRASRRFALLKSRTQIGRNLLPNRIVLILRQSPLELIARNVVGERKVILSFWQRPAPSSVAQWSLCPSRTPRAFPQAQPFVQSLWDR